MFEKRIHLVLTADAVGADGVPNEIKILPLGKYIPKGETSEVDDESVGYDHQTV